MANEEQMDIIDLLGYQPIIEMLSEEKEKQDIGYFEEIIVDELGRSIN